MKSLLLLSLVLSSLTVLQGCASAPNARNPASSCHDASTNSEDHYQNHCDNGPQSG